MLISVTEKDIRKGVRTSCRFCPIARAAKRAFKAVSVAVVSGKLFVESKEEVGMYLLPKSADDFIDAFDNGSKVEPFEFEVTK